MDPNIERSNQGAGEGDTALIIAAYFNHLESVNLLLRCPKTDIGVRDKFGKTALDYARERGWGHLGVVAAIRNRDAMLEKEEPTCPMETE